MNEANVSIKQRLVGAVVLVSLGIIFLPMILDGEGPFESVKRERLMPKAPQVRQVFDLASSGGPSVKPQLPPLAASDRVTVVDKISEQALKAKKKAITADSEADVQPASVPAPASLAKNDQKSKPASKSHAVIADLKKNNDKVVKAWAVQLGSFKTKPNALRLRDKLRKKGFPSYVEAVTTAKGESYRVRVGPESLLSNAENLKKKLSKVAKLDGIIVNH